MKSCKVRLEQIAEPENLREAFLRAARGKGHRTEVIAFRENLSAELDALRAGLLAGTVAVGQFVAFWERIVCAYEASPGRGLPIGALTSQHLANFFLGAARRGSSSI